MSPAAYPEGHGKGRDDRDDKEEDQLRPHRSLGVIGQDVLRRILPFAAADHGVERSEIGRSGSVTEPVLIGRSPPARWRNAEQRD